MPDDPKALFAELLDIARNLAQLHTRHYNPPGSVGMQLSRLQELEERILEQDDDRSTE